MPVRVEPLLSPPVLFAHRGASAHAPENTLEAFRLALRLGATGLETDVWLTADGVPVLDHDGLVGRLRRRRIHLFHRGALPPHIPTLAELYEQCGTGFDLSLDVKDPEVVGPVLEVARAAGAADRLWLCHPNWRTVATWREMAPEARLVDSTRLRLLKEGPERRAAQLREASIDAVNLRAGDWTSGLVTLFHRFGRLALGWDAQHVRVARELLHCGIDGIFGDHVDRLVDAATPRS